VAVSDCQFAAADKLHPLVHRILRHPTPLWTLLTAVGIAVACSGGAGDPGAERPLFDGAHQPDLLLEAKEIAWTPSTSGNRMLTGWWPWRRKPGAPLQLLPTAGSGSFEITQLEDRPRRLILDLSVAPEAVGRQVGVRVAGHSLAADLPLAERLEIDLPADLPLGRVPVELYLGEQQDVALRKIAIGPSLRPGEATFEGGDLLQTGASLVDVVRPVAAGSRLRGRFIPPAGAGAEQRFRLLVERETGSRTAFEWGPRPWWPFDGARDFDLALGAKQEGELVRIRLLALGQGPAGRWEGLRLVDPAASAPAAAPPSRTLAVTPPPAAPRIVLLYVMDALRADRIGHLGGPAGVSPTVDRLAAEGATFTNYLTVAPNTVPSVKTMLTGVRFLRDGGGKLPLGPVTLPERFAAAGYATALITGNGNLSAWNGLTRGFDYAPRWTHIAAEPQPGEALADYNDNAARCHHAALQWLDQTEPERAFLHLQTIHPHNPYDPPEPFRSRYTAGIASTIDGSTDTLLHLEHLRMTATEADEQRLRGLYTASVAYNDSELGKLMAALLERYPPDEILIVLTSDHGDELFDHGGLLHGYTLYEEQLRAPLVFWWPGHITPRTLDRAVDTVDLHQTLATLVPDPTSIETGGEALWDDLLGEAHPATPGRALDRHEVRFAAASSLEGGIFMARSERYKLLWAPRQGEEWGMGQGLGRGRDVELVFDLAEDPEERKNLAGEDILEVAWLRERLLRWIVLGELAEPQEGPEEPTLDEETRRNLRALGYIQ
jgi:arylsulfatase A-like enzyme